MRAWLDVPYKEKNEAKKLGAFWDPVVRKWYLPDHLTDDQSKTRFRKWMPNPQDYPAPDQGDQIVKNLRIVNPSEGKDQTKATCVPGSAGMLHIYTDGACKGNTNVRVSESPAGWGFVVVGGKGEVVDEQCGPVVTDKQSPHFLGAECGSNNTAELSAICQALIWLLEKKGRESVTLCFDSNYAAMIASGQWKAKQNLELAKRARELFQQVEVHCNISLKHVKGHSGHKWNDHADLLANKGLSVEFPIGHGQNRRPSKRSRD